MRKGAFAVGIAAALIAIAPTAPAAAKGGAAGPPKLLISKTGAPASAPVPTPRPNWMERYRSKARNAIILDLTEGEVLFERKAERAIPPASMTKLMTLFVTLQAVAEGPIDLATRFEIGERAARRPGSTMHLAAGDRPTLRELLLGLMVQSGNDAAVAVAEGVAGTERAFVARMNAAAKELGLKRSRFRNPTGLPAKGHRMSVRDLAALAARLIRDHPEAKPFFRTRSFEWGGVRQKNRNPMLFADLSDIGVVVDGMKTGYTAEAGYCAVVSAVKQVKDHPPRRVIVVLAGLPSEQARAREAERAVRWAFGRR